MLPVHLYCIPNKLVLRKETDIIHLAMGEVTKVFTLVEGGSKSSGGLRRGVKKVWRQKFSIAQPPHQSINEQSLNFALIAYFVLSWDPHSDAPRRTFIGPTPPQKERKLSAPPPHDEDYCGHITRGKQTRILQQCLLWIFGFSAWWRHELNIHHFERPLTL